MFQDLQRSNLDLALAYDATIGVVARPRLRDRETEGHTLRVTEIALSSPGDGVADEELIHMRRGGLLHDIGRWVCLTEFFSSRPIDR